MRIGVNGTEAAVGQAYRTLDTTITDSQYGPFGQPLSTIGTVIALEKGPETDEFFLTFDVLGTHQNVRLDPVPLAPAPPPDVQRPSDVGLRVFDEINATMAELTGVSPQDSGRDSDLRDASSRRCRRSRPSTRSSRRTRSRSRSSSIQYCNALVDEPDGACAVLPGLQLQRGARDWRSPRPAARSCSTRWSAT